MAPPSKKKKRSWTDSEDERLAAAIQSSGERNWKAKAAAVGTRDHVQCLQRWANVLKPRLTQGFWTEEEDRKLAALIAHSREQGIQPNWARIARKLKKGSARACRERWQFTLRHSTRSDGDPYQRPASLLHPPPPHQAHHQPSDATAPHPNGRLPLPSTHYSRHPVTHSPADFLASRPHLSGYTEPRLPPSVSFFRSPSCHLPTESSTGAHWPPRDSLHMQRHFDSATSYRSPDLFPTPPYQPPSWPPLPSHPQPPRRHP